LTHSDPEHPISQRLRKESCVSTDEVNVLRSVSNSGRVEKFVKSHS